MSFLHINRPRWQPLTRYEMDNPRYWHFGPDERDPSPWVRWKDPKPWVFEREPDELFWCHSCGRQKPASELVVAVSYADTQIRCRDLEYARSPEFPFEYRDICKGTAFKPKPTPTPEESK